MLIDGGVAGIRRRLRREWRDTVKSSAEGWSPNENGHPKVAEGKNKKAPRQRGLRFWTQLSLGQKISPSLFLYNKVLHVL